MDLISHAVFAMVLGGHFDVWLVAGALLPDIDKLYTYPKKGFRGAGSHTALGELPLGLLLVLVVETGAVIAPGFGAALGPLGLGILSHLLLDFLTGETGPFRPFLRERVGLAWGLKVKIVLGAVIWIIGGVLFGEQLWTYANGLMG